MQDSLKCPKCKSVYVQRGSSTKYCSNSECILSYHESAIKTDWRYILNKLRYPSIRGMYYAIKNRLFKRYDLIRTGACKSSWSDKDYLMFEGMMGLLVSYIEDERPYEMFAINIVDDGGECDASREFSRKQAVEYQKLLALYIDYKVTYPKLVAKEELSLNAWAKSSSMDFGDSDGLRRLISFTATEGYSESDRKELLDVHHNLEVAVYDLEQDLLKRLVDLRSLLWV